MENTLKPVARKNDIVVQEIKGETLLYDLKTNKAYCLNETSVYVWQLCDGRRTASTISDELSVLLNTLISEEFVWLALDQLDKNGLLEGEVENIFEGLSRREVIKKVGFASVVGLPIVSSIVAPPAAMAQSGVVGVEGLCTPGVCVAGTTCVPANDGITGADRCCVNPSGTNFTTAVSEFCSVGIVCSASASLCCTGNISRITDNPGCAIETCRCI